MEHQDDLQAAVGRNGDGGGVSSYNERRAAAVAALRPKKDPIHFIRPGRCTGLWLDKDAKGCGHVVRIHYMSPPVGSRRRKKFRVDAAVCPICGANYPFAFYKLKADDEYVPSPEEEQDIRLLHLDLQRMAKGEEPEYDPSLEDRIRWHSRGAPPQETTTEAS